MSFRVTEEPTLAVFWDLCQGKELNALQPDGKTAESYRGSIALTDSHGACLTLSISEFHSGAVVCSLSDILETGDVPQRFFLSATACKGILRRAAKRGRLLPPQLERALQTVARGTGPEVEIAKTS